MVISNKVRLSVEIEEDLAAAVNKAASASRVTATDIISDCIRQQFETAMRHRVLLQRQSNVDEALIELARLVGRLSAGEGGDRENICRYRPLDGK